MIVDVIILSGSFDEDAIKMTNNTIRTLKESEEEISFNIVLVETVLKSKEEAEAVGYSASEYVFPNEVFNYNRFLNYASPFLKGQYVVISNNDVIFYKDWMSNAIREMNEHKLHTASCYSPGWQCHDSWINYNGTALGWRISHEFCGWNLIFRREVYETILPFDEQFDYCFQDNDLACRLQQLEYRHGLICSSKVRHLVSRSRKYFDEQQFHIDFANSSRRFSEKWNR